MWESKQYRDEVAKVIKETPKDERKDLLEKEQSTPEYEVAILAKNFEISGEREKEARDKFNKASRVLNLAISPTSVEFKDMQGYDSRGNYKDNVSDRHKFFMAEAANDERFNTMFRMMLDENVKQKFIALYAEVDSAKAEYVAANELQKTQYEMMDTEIKRLGGRDAVQKMLGDRSRLLDSYIESAKEGAKRKQEAKDKLWSEKSPEETLP